MPHRCNYLTPATQFIVTVNEGLILVQDYTVKSKSRVAHNKRAIIFTGNYWTNQNILFCIPGDLTYAMKKYTFIILLV